jgi:hypothetical protein
MFDKALPALFYYHAMVCEWSTSSTSQVQPSNLQKKRFWFVVFFTNVFRSRTMMLGTSYYHGDKTVGDYSNIHLHSF